MAHVNASLTSSMLSLWCLAKVISRRNESWTALFDNLRCQRLPSRGQLEGSIAHDRTLLKIVSKLDDIQQLHSFVLISSHIVPQILFKHTIDTLSTNLFVSGK